MIKTELMIQRANEEPICEFFLNISFSDELGFLLNGSVNKRNCTYWDNINAHVFLGRAHPT